MRPATIVRQGFVARGPETYAWPSMVRTASRELLVAASAREGHDCPDGRIVLFRSRDEGVTWSDPTQLVSSVLDDRHPTLVRTNQGVLICAWISTDIWTHPKVLQPRWEARARALLDATRIQVGGDWLRRSFDDGRTWEPKTFRMPAGAATRCSPVALADGNLGCFGYDEARALTGDFTLHYFVSSDLGESWTTRGEVPTEKLERAMTPWIPWRLSRNAEVAAPSFGVRCFAETAPGHLLCLYATRWSPDWLRQVESRDGGRTWSFPRVLEVSGLAPFIVPMASGALHCFYTDRGDLPSVKVVTSGDGGDTWPEERAQIIDAWTDFPDAGFPTAVAIENENENENERFLVAYHVDRNSTRGFRPGPRELTPEGLLYRVVELP